MVELRKRPQRDPPAPTPARKKSKAKAGAVSTAPAEPRTEASTAPAPDPAPATTSVVGKAKRAASKVKQVVVGQTSTGESGATDSAAKQLSVEDAPSTTVEKGEAGMIPETVGTSGTATVPGTSAGEGSSGTAVVQHTPSTAEGKAIRSKAKNLGLMGSSTPATTSAAAATAPSPPAAAEAEESRPPATEDLENPPEKGKVDTAAATGDTAGESVETTSVPLSPASVGKQIPDLNTFGGALETHTGTKVTFAELLSQSTGGLIVFTYPRASTPGCTQQACSFRDHHDAFTGASGHAIYGLSTDSTKDNTNFATKQNLQYPLLCDPQANLTAALGMKKPGNAKGTVRGVVVVDKAGVVKVWFQGGAPKTVDAVKKFLAAGGK